MRIVFAAAMWHRRHKTTHRQLAAELGTAREVVSRQLQEFQRRGWAGSVRGELEIMAPRT